MGGHHKAPYEVPDYSIYKVQGCERLEQLQERLAKKGLKDPWIRNEVWRFHPGFGTKWHRVRSFFFRGFGVGLALTGLTVLYDKTLGGGDSHHGDSHHEDSDHGNSDDGVCH